MKILVTGGNGFIGSNLINRLIREGHQVHSLDNLSTGTKANEIDGCHYHYGEIENVHLMDKDFNIIFHIAALARIQASFEFPHKTFESNVIGTEAVLEFARSIGAEVVYAGSSSRWHDPSQSPYAMSKYLGEELVKMYNKSFGLKTQIARFYNVYGPNEIVDGDYAAVIGIWRRQVRDGKPITIVGDGEQRRDFTHVVDIVDGLYKIAMSKYNHEDAWELGTGVNYSINEVYAMFKARFNVDKVNIPDQPGNYRVTLREHDDALNILQWKPENRLNEYVRSL